MGTLWRLLGGEVLPWITKCPIKEVLPPGVAVSVGVEVLVGVAVATLHASPLYTFRPHPFSVPTSTGSTSLTLRDQTPAAPCPLNTDSGFCGRKVPLTVSG